MRAAASGTLRGMPSVGLSRWYNRYRHLSDHVSYIHGHFFDLRVVIALDVLHRAHVVVRDKVDRHASPPKSTTATDAMQVILHVRRQIIVDDQRNLLHIDAACQ